MDAPKPRRSLAAVATGAAIALVFLSIGDAENMPPATLAVSRWLVVLPAAFLLALRPGAKAWKSGLALAGGLFTGTCLYAIAAGSNIWPIAGVYWTALWAPQVAIGTVAGALVARALRSSRAGS